MTETAFDKQIGATLNFEGGYVDDPDDSGGETNFGISKRSYPDVDIANLTRAEAIKIYRLDYFVVPGFAQLPDRIGAKVFDLGVNMGPATATKLLQRALNSLGVRPPLSIDGGCGMHTIQASKEKPEGDVVDRLVIEATNHYIALAAEHHQMRKYLRGWLRRASAISV
jgi:lysozyme family protein